MNPWACTKSAVGRDYTGTRVILLVRDLHVRVVDANTGELRRDLD